MAQQDQPNNAQKPEGAEAASCGRLPIEKPPQVKKLEVKKQPSEGHDEVTGDEWNIVDEASWESFPASDPPAYVRGTDTKTSG